MPFYFLPLIKNQNLISNVEYLSLRLEQTIENEVNKEYTVWAEERSRTVADD